MRKWEEFYVSIIYWNDCVLCIQLKYYEHVNCDWATHIVQRIYIESWLIEKWRIVTPNWMMHRTWKWIEVTSWQTKDNEIISMYNTKHFMQRIQKWTMWRCEDGNSNTDGLGSIAHS